MTDTNKEKALLGGEIELGLSKVRIQNFKSISTDKSQEIQIGPLTILCGENSSGKSTLIQSILLLFQALNEKDENTNSLKLNGKLINLGSFKNILHKNNEIDDDPNGIMVDFDESGDAIISGVAIQEMQLGIEFNKLYKTSVIGGAIELPTNTTFEGRFLPNYIDTHTDIRGNVQLPGGWEAFPRLASARLEVYEVQENTYGNDIQVKREIEKKVFDFREITNESNKSIVIDIVWDRFYSEDKKDFIQAWNVVGINPTSQSWICDYKTEIGLMDNYTKQDDESYGKIDFLGGIPDKVAKNTNISSFLAREMANKVKELISSRDYLIENLFQEYDAGIFPDDETLDSATSINDMELKEEFISLFTRWFKFTTATEHFNTMYTDIKPEEAIPSTTNLDEYENPDNYFSMPINILPNLKDYYGSKKEAAFKLIRFSSDETVYSFLLDSIMQRLIPRIVKTLQSDGVSLEDTNKALLSALNDALEEAVIAQQELEESLDFLIQEATVEEREVIAEENDQYIEYEQKIESYSLEIENLKSEIDFHEASMSLDDDSEQQIKVPKEAILNFLSEWYSKNRGFIDELEKELFVVFEEYFNSVEPDLSINVSIKDETEAMADANWTLSNLRKLSKELRYIGPLRRLENEEVKINSFDENIPMGIDGEYFFNYFEKVKDTTLKEVKKVVKADEYYSGEEKFPDSLSDIYDDLIPGSSTINKVFSHYLEFFGIADEFITEYSEEDNKITGYIKPKDLNKYIKMKELGVGFSQLAPIILLCITSRPGTIILLEQPELHLHPNVQQKFADFIVEMIQDRQLQIIIETHSDHILNRVRRRIAQAKLEDNDDSLFEKCSIYFAERIKGATKFRKAKLTNSGTYDLTDFPKGFFDQGAEDAFFILKASLEDEN